jgi:hypothetical protein
MKKLTQLFILILFLFSLSFAQESRTTYRIRRVPTALVACQPGDVYYAINTKLFGFCWDVNTTTNLLTGSGTASRIALWNGTGSLSSDSGFTFSGTGATFTLVVPIVNFGTTFLQQDAANTLALHNSTNAQRVNIGNTFTDSTHKEDLSLYFSSNVAHIGTTQTGATARSLQIDYGGTTTPAITVPITSGTINIGGLISTTSGITFGGTTLANYDEGSFTPTAAFGGNCVSCTYTLQLGKYTRVGDTVFFVIHVTLSSKGSSTGIISLKTLPVAPAAVSGQQQIIAGAVSNATYTGQAYLVISGASSTTDAFVYIIANSNGVATQMADTNASATTDFNFSGSYRTN